MKLHHTMPLVEYVVDVVVKFVGDFSSLHSGKLAFQLPTQLRVRERPFIRGSSFATALKPTLDVGLGVEKIEFSQSDLLNAQVLSSSVIVLYRIVCTMLWYR
jgi:hypothetical protein